MLDPARLRAQPDEIAAGLARRGCSLDRQLFARLDGQVRKIRQETEQLRSERNAAARAIGERLAAGDQSEAEQLKQQAAAGGERLESLSASLRSAQARLHEFMLALPNLPDPAVPAGAGEGANVELEKLGRPRQFDFPILDHVALGERLAGLDLAAAAGMAGARFALLSGDLARLHRALARFMLELHVREHGYREYWLPYLVNAGALVNSGQLPKFADQLFASERDGLYLIPTAEVALVNVAAGCLLAPEALPLRMVAHTPSFRREAGAGGRDTRGMIRQHQFDKVELVQITEAAASEAALAEITSHAERVLLELLELPYRRVELCAGDLGEAAARTLDLEVWLPSQRRYREISSCSNCRDYQARRLQARVRRPGKQPNELVHTLNGSGLAVGRTLVAVLENHQQEGRKHQHPTGPAPVHGRRRGNRRPGRLKARPRMRTRFAPSPTGGLHLGGARTALYCWAHARRCGGQFLLRIDDTDRVRSRPEFERSIIDGLDWLGLRADEPPLRQSERGDHYRAAAARLLEEGSAYRCYATVEELADLRASQIAAGEKPRYDRRWRDRRDQPAGRDHVVRFATPAGGQRRDRGCRPRPGAG